MEALEPWLNAQGLCCVSTPDRGFCLKTNRPFKRGETVLKQGPYASVFDTDSGNCDNCCVAVSEASALKRCGRCKAVRYCSVQCQKDGWKNSHSAECPILTDLHKQGRHPPPSLVLLLRVLLKRRQQLTKGEAVAPSDHYSLINRLETNRSKLSQERLLEFAQMAALVATFAPRDTFESSEELTNLLSGLACNAHTICDPEMRTVGKGIYPVLSLCNHSCAPTAFLLFQGATAELKMLQSTGVGEEVCISYIDLTQPACKRRHELLQGYLFWCGCPRCGEAEAGGLHDALLGGFPCSFEDCARGCTAACGGGGGAAGPSAARLQCLQCKREADYTAAQAAAQQVDALVERARKQRKQGGGGAGARDSVALCQEALAHTRLCSTPVGFRRTKAYDELMWTRMDQQDWAGALEACRLSLPGYLAGDQGQEGPLLGLQQYTLGKLEWCMGHTGPAVGALQSATRILEATHGRAHPLTTDLAMLFAEVQAAHAHETAAPARDLD